MWRRCSIWSSRRTASSRATGRASWSGSARGPTSGLARNPRFVYGRITGFGQEGPLAQSAGHDINYISLAGVLGHVGRRDQPPTPPLALLGDFGGGGMFMAFGIVCALLERASSGEGQVIDAAMVDGAASLMTVFHGAEQSGFWNNERGTNLLDSGAPYYDAYETSDGEFVSLGAIEPQFWAEFLKRTGLDAEGLPAHTDPAGADALRTRLQALFETKTRAEWCEVLEGTDVCFAPVLTMAEAREHPHAKARGAFVEIDGVKQPRPAPRFSRTDSGVQRPPEAGAASSDAILADFGFEPDRIAALRESGAVH